MEELTGSHSTLDEMFVALSHVERRRLLLRLLEENPQQVPHADVRASGESADRKHLRIEMHHRHLPKLEGEGFVRWDRNGDVVTTGPQFDEIEPLLELLDDHRDELPADLA